MPADPLLIELLEEFVASRPELQAALETWLAILDQQEGGRDKPTQIFEDLFTRGTRELIERPGLDLPTGVNAEDLEVIAREAARIESTREGDPAFQEQLQTAEASTLIQEYRDAGFREIQVTEDGRIFAYDAETQERSIELNSEEFDRIPISQGEERFDEITRAPIPLLPESELTYMLDPSYEINIPIDDYYSMLRWLDPAIKERVEDSQRVEEYFRIVADREEALETRAQRIAERQAGGVEGKIGSGIGPGRGGIPFGGAGYVPYVPPTIAIGGKYANGDEARLFVTKSSEYIASIQALMLKGNILTKNDIAKNGSWGMAEEAAIAPHLFAADRRGLSIRQWLEEVAENPLPETQPTGFTQPVYNSPDFATMSQNVKNAFRTQLGREPEPYEMGDLIMQLEQDHWADYQSQVDAARMEWNARQQAVETGEEQTTGTVQDVDPFARMKQAFDKRFGPERERQVDVAEHGANVGLLMNSLAGLEQQVER